MSNHPNKPSKLRYKAMLEDVRKRVWYALSSKNHENPYSVDDKRHDRFTRELYRARAVDNDFEDTCAMMGADTSQWTQRVHPNPGPVRPIAELI